MKITRRFTSPKQDPLDAVTCDHRSTVITEPGGTEVFRLDDFEVPSRWSKLATDIVTSNSFRKRDVPDTDHETSVRQIILRLARTIRNGACFKCVNCGNSIGCS